MTCSFTDIYKMKTIKDIPFHLPMNKSLEWYIEFYTVACYILKDVDRVRYEVCYQKLKECIMEESRCKT